MMIPTLQSRPRYRTGQMGIAPVACGPYRRAQSTDYAPQLEGCAPAGRCRDTLAGAVAAAVVAGAGPIALVIPISVRMRIDAILVVTSGAAGFTLQDFVINNSLAWSQGQVFHSAIFAPGADANTSFAGDLVAPGSTVQISYTNLDGAAAQTIWVALKGPGV